MNCCHYSKPHRADDPRKYADLGTLLLRAGKPGSRMEPGP